MKIYTIIVLILLLPIAYAWGEGDYLTQQQVNNIDADTINLQCRYEGFYWSYGEPQIYFNFSCLNIIPEGEQYLIFREGWRQSYYTLRYIACRLTHGWETSRLLCISYIREEMVSEFNNHKLSIRENIKRYQPINDITGQDFNITEGELN